MFAGSGRARASVCGAERAAPRREQDGGRAAVGGAGCRSGSSAPARGSARRRGSATSGGSSGTASAGPSSTVSSTAGRRRVRSGCRGRVVEDVVRGRRREASARVDVAAVQPAAARPRVDPRRCADPHPVGQHRVRPRPAVRRRIVVDHQQPRVRVERVRAEQRDRRGVVDALPVGHHRLDRQLDVAHHRPTAAGDRAPPPVHPHRPRQRHRRARQHQQVVAVRAQVADPEPAEVQHVLPVAHALREDPQREAARVRRILRGAHLQHHGPAAQHRAAQADVEPVADDRETADVEAVVLARDGEERREVRVGAQQVDQGLRMRGADQRGAAAVAGDAHRLGVAVDAELHGEPHDDEPVRVAPQLAEPADHLLVVVDRLGPAAHQRVRPDRPQPAAAAGHPLQVGLAVRAARAAARGRPAGSCAAARRAWAPSRSRARGGRSSRSRRPRPTGARRRRGRPSG